MGDSPQLLCFDEFTLDLANRRLTRSGVQVELGARYFDALVLLVTEAGSLVSKDRFMEEIWRGIPVTDEALTQCIRTLRRALGDDASSPRFIQTVPKHGYRFLVEPEDAAVKVVAPNSKSASHSKMAGQVAGAATLAGGLAGAAGGLFYGVIASQGGASMVMVLTALVAALGVLAGAGLGLGMAGAIAWRGRADMALIPAAGMGGVVAGALGGSLGRDGIALLTSAQLGPVTGLFEGLVLGSAAGLASYLALSRRLHLSGLAVGTAAAVLGAMSGLLIDLVGGRLLGGSLLAVQQDLGGTRLAIDPTAGLLAWIDSGWRAGLFGFGGITAVAEAAVFVLAIALGMVAVRDYLHRDANEKGAAPRRNRP